MSESPVMLVPSAVAVRLPMALGMSEILVASSVRVAVVLPAMKVTVWERSELSSQSWCWSILTVTSSSCIAALVRVSMKTRSSIPAPTRGYCAAMVTTVCNSRVTVTV